MHITCEMCIYCNTFNIIICIYGSLKLKRENDDDDDDDNDNSQCKRVYRLYSIYSYI